MDDKRAWFAYFAAGAGLIALALLALLLMTPQAHAQAPQQPICAPMSQLVPAWQEVHSERIVWEGVTATPSGPIELVLFQSEKGTWSLFVVQGGIACLRAAGQSGTAIQTGKGV